MYSETYVYADEEFKISFTEMDGDIFMHCYVDVFKKSTYSRIKKEFLKIRKAFKKEGVTALYAISPNKRFVEAMGFKHFSDIEGEEETKVYIWELRYLQTI